MVILVLLTAFFSDCVFFSLFQFYIVFKHLVKAHSVPLKYTKDICNRVPPSV